MSDEPAELDLVALFYRANWTRLRLSARVSGMVDFGVLASQAESASPLGRGIRLPLLPPAHLGVRRFAGTLRLTPGGRYVVDISEPARIDEADMLYAGFLASNGFCAGAGSAPLRPPYPDLLCPARLLNGFTLDLRGEVATAAGPGRRAFAVVATPVPGARADLVTRPERIEVIADAESGILLRSEETFEGRTLRVTELADVTFGVPGSAFTMPDGDDRRFGSLGSTAFTGLDGPGWTAARIAINAAGTVLGSVIRQAPGGRGPDAPAVDPEGAMPPDDEASRPVDRAESGSGGSAGVDDDLLHAMHGSGRAEFSGTLHTWADVAMMAEPAQAKTSSHGWGGVGLAAGAIGSRLGVVHTVDRVQTGGGGRYRVEHVLPVRRSVPRIATCDGQRLWRVFADKVVISPAAPLKREVADMVDTSPLLECQLTDVRETVLGGRRAFALPARRAASSWSARPRMIGGDVVVDAELGIVLRFVWRIDGKPAYRREFRDVTAGRGDGQEFHGHVPPAVRVVHADGSLLDDVAVSLPPPVRVAAKAAGSGLKAARGFLDSLSERRGH
jgi:hypothetical protein